MKNMHDPLAPGVTEGMWIKVGGNYTNVVLRYDWWTHGDGWLLSERKNVYMHAVQIATKWCNSLNYGHCAINNTTRPVKGLLFESWNRERRLKGRKGTLSVNYSNRMLPPPPGSRKKWRVLWLRCQPQMSGQCYLSAPVLGTFWERERERLGLAA